MIHKKWLVYLLIFALGFLTNTILIRNNVQFDLNISVGEDNSLSSETNEDSVITTQSQDTQITLGEMTSLSQGELKALIDQHFKGFFHAVGDQGPVEYLQQFLPNNSGCSIDNWLNPAMNYLSSYAFLLDDGSEQSSIQNETYKALLMDFIPELYALKENGIYWIDNAGVIYVYIKMDQGDYQKYIDYMFLENSELVPSYKIISAADNAEYVYKEPEYEIYPVADFYHEATKKGAQFNGFFYNIDHSNPAVFLNNGPQTTNTNDQKILSRFNDQKDLSTLMEIYQYISEEAFRNGDGEKFGRSVDEIMDSEILTGCTDYGLVFASLARDKGIPTVFVQTARVDWIYERVRNDDRGILGHILIEVYIDGQWRLVDSTAGRYYPEYDVNNFSLNDGYYVFAKSLEVWDATIADEAENAQIMRDLFKNFNLDAYNDPVYDYIELKTGTQREGMPFAFGQQTVTKASDAN